MAFTELEIREAEKAVDTAANAEDMFRLGLIYSTDMEDRGPDFVEAHKWFSPHDPANDTGTSLANQFLDTRCG